ncbi:MAG: M48 family metalloprotease [Nitratireductor sp.]|nr:M48 family metalloprotease [Nitratireductor sp.]
MNTAPLSFFRQRQHAFLNAVHTWLLVGGSLALLAICAWVFFGANGIVYAAIFGGISLFMASRVSPQMVLRMYKAQAVSRERFPAGHAILDQLVERSGLERRPDLYVMPSNLMNAFAVGRKHNAAIAMTDRLIRAMSQRELAGVMAHEITHITNEDVRVMAIADMVSRFTSLLSSFGLFAVLANLPAILFGGGAAVPWTVVLIMLFAPTVGGMLQLALSRTREYDADLGAVLLTGDPNGLASALVKLENAQKRHWEGMVLPGGRVPNPSLLRTHPRTGDRIARLMALKQPPETIGEIARGEKAPEAIIPEALRRQLPQRSSPVPRVRRKWGRSEHSKYQDYAALMGAGGVPSAEDGWSGDKPASDTSLADPDGRPRIRIRHGGVWW